jgi:glycosyltransferase involved in cell wall biosynthesis
MPAHAALQYAPSAFAAGTAKIMGRQSAGAGFLRAWVRHADADPLTCFTASDGQADDFAVQVAGMGWAGPTERARVGHEAALVEAGALWLADPSLGPHAWHRRSGGQDRWSIVGITHTMNTHAAMDRVVEYLTAPVQPWDALICTSRAVKSAVERMLHDQADYLRARLGATLTTGPELPVIPLGVHCEDFQPDPSWRARWRAELGIPDDAVVVLQLGRLAIHAKAHPLPLYLALERAVALGAPRPHMVFAGQFPDARQERDFRNTAAAFADRIVTHFVDGARAEVGPTIWAAADVFSLLSDNHQESFGLAPVEAMAAGLPVVASDWDGLRDTIEEGVTGFRAATLQPAPGCGEIVARRYAVGIDSFDGHSGATVQAIAIDIAQAGAAFHRLLTDADLRARMGAAARARALAHYDWRVVIGQYRELLDDLAARRAGGRGERAKRAPGQPPMASRADPFRTFGAHATHAIDGATRLAKVAGSPDRVADVPGGPQATLLVSAALPPVAVIDAMIDRLGQGPATLRDLALLHPATDGRLIACAAGWLVKCGFAQVA